MAILSRNSEPDPEPVCNNNNDGARVVFIDTNLDTHLAVIVSKNDTVSDLKKRIFSEHPLSFPTIGQIQIHAIKVKRKGYFYHLSNSMFVRSAFHGFNKSWFLSVDASALEEPGQNKLLCSSGSPNQLACLGNANNGLIGPVDIAIDGEKEECPSVNPCVSEHSRKESEKDLETGVNHELPSLQIECNVDGSKKGLKDDSNVCEKVSSISLPSANKRQKSKRKKEDAVQDNTSKEKIASVDNLLSFASKKVSSNKHQPLQLENKQDKGKEIPFAIPNVSEHSGKELVKNLETGVKSSGNNDPGIPLPGSIPETHCVNLELLSSHIECEVDGSSKGVKDDCNVCGDGTSKSVPSAKKNQKSKRKKEDMMQYNTSKENDGSVVGPGNDTVQQDIAVVTNPSENAHIEVLNGTEVVKEHQHTECNDNNMKNGIDTESIKEASEPVHATNKKHGKRKRSLIHDAKEILKVEAIYQKVEAEKSDEACKERKESKDQFEFNNDISRDDVEYKHNMVTEVVSDIKPPANKKQKSKAKSGDKSSSKRNMSMISDSNVDNVSHQILGVQQKIKISSADQSAEHLNDTDPLRTSEQGGRRKGKKKYSVPHDVHVVTSSRKDDEADRTSIQEGVQEEISEDGLISKDITMSKPTLENMEIGADACKEGFPSKVKKAGNNKHCDSDMEVHPSDVNKPKELTEDNVNVVLNHGHRSEADQTEGAEEGRDVLQQNDLKPMLLEECTPSNQDNIDANIKELNVTSKVVDVNGMAEPVKSEKKRKRTKKAKDSDGELTLREAIGPVDASESETVIVRSLKSVNCNPASGNTETEENSSNHTEGKYIQQEMAGTVLSATDKEDEFRADNAGSLQQIKIKGNTKHVDKAQRKKSNNKQISTSKSVSSMLTKDEVLDSEKPSPSSDSAAHASPSSKITKKNKSASTKSTNKSSKRNLEPSKNLVGLEPSDSQFMSGSNGSSQFPSNTPKVSYNVGPFEANDAAKDSTRSFGEKDDNNLEAPSKTNKVSADQQLPSEQLQHEANKSDEILVDKMNGSDRQDLDLLTEQNADKREATKGQTHVENLSSSQQLSSKAEHDVLGTNTDKKVPNGRKNGREAKLSSWSNSNVSSIRDNKKPQVNASGKSMDLKKRREGLEGSKKMVQKKAEASRNDVGGVVGKTQQKKSLLAGAIFKDDSSGTSEDVDKVDNSDASTRTPSDNSLSSDFSDGDSSAGSHGGKRLENDGRSAVKANMSSTKGMSIDRILRSSSRYKKAKITASQLEGTESQPEFVPDSLA